jgi:hypothetical protein
MQNNQNQPIGTAFIWNPNAAANWSFLFTPAFGSYLQMKNWKTLGQPGKATSSKIWFYISLLILAAPLAVTVFAQDDRIAAAIPKLGIPFLLIWYFASARGQAKYVKETLGNQYHRKSFVKPLLAGVALAAVYAFMVGLLATTLGATHRNDHVAEADDHAVGNTSAGGSSFSLATLFGGTKLDCASPDVKDIITGNYAEQLAEAGAPDLVMAISQQRIKFRVEMISEVVRNNQSKNVACSGKLVVEFPKEDLARAAQVKESKIVEASIRGFRMPTDPVFSTTLSYLVSIPADKAEKQNGPLVKMTTREGVKAGEGDLGPYMVAYTMLAYATPDITVSSKNTKPWDKEWKATALQGCAEHQSPELCACKFSQFEKLVSQDDMQRIGFSIQSNALIAAKYANFIAVSEALNKQCPSTQSIAELIAPKQETAAPDAAQPQDQTEYDQESGDAEDSKSTQGTLKAIATKAGQQ